MSRVTRLFIVSAACVVLPVLGGSPVVMTATIRQGGVHALFDLDRKEASPFPTDIFTVPDDRHATGRRISLPYPDCSLRVSDCQDLDVINTLDGFGLQPRISIPFDGPIDPDSVGSDAVFLVDLDTVATIGIN